jgi:hypothetical protein
MTSRQRLLWMLPLLLLAAGLAMFGDKTPVQHAEVVAPVLSKNDSAAHSQLSDGAEKAVQEAAYAGSPIRRLQNRDRLGKFADLPAVDVFAGLHQDGMASVPVSVPTDSEEVPEQGFALIGRILEKGRWSVFLEREGRTYIAHSGDRVEGFRVDAVDNEKVVLSNVSTQKKHVITMNDKGGEPANEK